MTIHDTFASFMVAVADRGQSAVWTRVERADGTSAFLLLGTPHSSPDEDHPRYLVVADIPSDDTWIWGQFCNRVCEALNDPPLFIGACSGALSVMDIHAAWQPPPPSPLVFFPRMDIKLP